MIHHHAVFDTAPEIPSDGFVALAGCVVRFERGQEIYAQDQASDRIYQVLRGAVRMSRVDQDGRRQVGAFHDVGDLFGLEEDAGRGFGAEALSDCELAAARPDALAKIAGPAALDHFLAAAAVAKLRRNQAHLILLGRKNAIDKVAGFLLDAADKCDRSAAVDLTMGRQDLADYLGLTIETVSRMITQLSAEGAVLFEGCRRFRVRNRALLERCQA